MAPIDYSVFEDCGGIPKVRAKDGQQSIPERKRSMRLDKAAQERACREIVRKRDHGKCRIPGCKDATEHLHHVTYRSKGGKWIPANIASLCASHHHMVHLGKITIRGNADEELIIEGDTAALRFKL